MHDNSRDTAACPNSNSKLDLEIYFKRSFAPIDRVCAPIASGDVAQQVVAPPLCRQRPSLAE